MQFENKTRETIDYLEIFSGKITWLLRPRNFGNFDVDSVNILSKNKAEIKTRTQNVIKVEFDNINDLLEKIICEIAKTKKTE